MNEQLALWCKRGHLMDEDNTRLAVAVVSQACKACLRIHLAAVRQWRVRRSDHKLKASGVA